MTAPNPTVTEDTKAQEGAAKLQQQWLMMESNFLLDHFFVSGLNIEFTPPPENAAPGEENAVQMRTSFDYTVGSHKGDPLKFRMNFRVSTQELTATGTPVGRKVEAEIIGFFSFVTDREKDAKFIAVRLNGTNMLYGILRGIIASATGTFPGGALMLPTFMPQRIVAMVEQDQAKAKARAQAEAVVKRSQATEETTLSPST